MSKIEVSPWREARRRSARDAILDAAWRAVGEDGLASLSMRDLARRAGVTTPTLYAYFDSKNDIYDAMFGQAAASFEAEMSAPYATDDPEETLRASVGRFFEFCTADLARYQLLFQKCIPGFEPSAGAYAPAVGALEGLRRRLVAAGMSEQWHLDLWTALVSGLVSQQVANDQGGDRWRRLVDDAVAMFVAYGDTKKKGR
jgi:AcrR family transcriptional regulator